MVRVDATTSDQSTAWRVRDSLASHPVLGGGAASISVIANHNSVVLEGWAMDESVVGLAIKLAGRAAARRAISTRLAVRNCRETFSGPQLC